MEKNLKVGQLVLLLDELKVRDKWDLGRISEVFRDANHVRGVVVKLADGREFTRDRSKIVALELDIESENA